MNRVIAFALLLLFALDFVLRVFVSHSNDREWELNIANIEVFTHKNHEQPTFNEHLFGFIEPEAPQKPEVVITEEVVKEPPFNPVIRAIYTSPTPYVIVAQTNESPSIKLTLGGVLLGHSLVSVDATKVTFEKQGNKKIFRMFKK